MHHDELDHLIVLLGRPLLFADVGIDVVEPPVPAVLAGFEVLALGLEEHLVADALPVPLELLSIHNAGQEGELLGAPALSIDPIVPKGGHELVPEELMVFLREELEDGRKTILFLNREKSTRELV